MTKVGRKDIILALALILQVVKILANAVAITTGEQEILNIVEEVTKKQKKGGMLLLQTQLI